MFIIVMPLYSSPYASVNNKPTRWSINICSHWRDKHVSHLRWQEVPVIWCGKPDICLINAFFRAEFLLKKYWISTSISLLFLGIWRALLISQHKKSGNTIKTFPRWFFCLVNTSISISYHFLHNTGSKDKVTFFVHSQWTWRCKCPQHQHPWHWLRLREIFSWVADPRITWRPKIRN